jgi:hypothetical protein
MFGVNNSIWGFFKVSNLKKKNYFILIFFCDGPIKEAHCKTTPSHPQQKNLKGTPTNQYGSHYHIIFSGLTVIYV